MQRERGAMSSINITPLTDVLLVLLITFLLTATAFEAPPSEVPLPRVATSQELADKAVVLTVDRDGAVNWAAAGGKLEGPTERALLQLRRDSDRAVLALAVHRELAYGSLYPLLRAAHQAGWQRVVVLTETNS